MHFIFKLAACSGKYSLFSVSYNRRFGGGAIVRKGTHDYLPDESRDIIGPVDSARRGALLREVPPIEEPAESAAKKPQCVRSHRPKVHRQRPQSLSRGRLEPEVTEGFHVVSSPKNS